MKRFVASGFALELMLDIDSRALRPWSETFRLEGFVWKRS